MILLPPAGTIRRCRRLGAPHNGHLGVLEPLESFLRRIVPRALFARPRELCTWFSGAGAAVPACEGGGGQGLEDCDEEGSHHGEAGADYARGGLGGGPDGEGEDACCEEVGGGEGYGACDRDGYGAAVILVGAVAGWEGGSVHETQPKHRCDGYFLLCRHLEGPHHSYR